MRRLEGIYCDIGTRINYQLKQQQKEDKGKYVSIAGVAVPLIPFLSPSFSLSLHLNCGSQKNGN